MATEFICQSCGAKHKRWVGKCSACNEWNTISEEDIPAKSGSLTGLDLGKKKFEMQNIELLNLSDQKPENIERIASGIGEMDRVMGGGFVRGGATLIGGEPGIGKSTLLLQLAGALSKQAKQVLYVSGEESVSQIFMRAERLQIANQDITVASTGSILDVLHKIEKNTPDIMIVDSIQTVYLSTIEANPGTVNQIRGSTFELINYCKNRNIILILVGHVTKDGQLAGPKLLEHMVDTVIYFEGESDKEFRMLRSVKNRFGSIAETGIFIMGSKGLEEVSNPSSFFMQQRQGGNGGVIFVAMEGTRPVITEVESLAAPSYLPSPRRNVVGWDANRLAMIIAILQNRCKVALYDRDIYLSMAGGFKTLDPAADLAVAVSLVNAKINKPVKDDVAVLGEVALSGEIRSVPWLENRCLEAIKLGYTNFIIPSGTIASKLSKINGVTIIGCKHISEVCK